MGAVGDAEVIRVGPCPEIQPGEAGTVVTGIFRHQADKDAGVVKLKLEGQVELIAVSGNHAFWSVDRREFVEAAGLRVDELVDTEYDERRVLSVTPLDDYTGFLYNLETLEHVYRVGSVGTLVHNSCVNRGGSYGDLRDIAETGERVHHMPQNAANVVPRNRGPALGMTEADHALTRTFSGRGRVTNALDAGLTPMERLQKDIDDIRGLFGDKYDEGIEEMLEYAQSLPEFN